MDHLNLDKLAELPNLKNVRQRRGLTTRRLAEKTGLSISTLSELETLKRRAQPGTAIKIAEALEVSNIELIREDFFDLDEARQKTAFFMYEDSEMNLTFMPDALLQLHGWHVIEEHRRRGLKTPTIEALEEMGKGSADDAGD